MDTVKVRFLTTRVVQDHRAGTSDEERFNAGEVYDLPFFSAQHWINRGIAELEMDKPEPEPEVAPEPEPEPVVEKHKGTRQK